MKKILVFLGFCGWVTIFGSLCVVFLGLAFFVGIDVFNAIKNFIAHPQFKYTEPIVMDILLPSFLTMLSILMAGIMSWLTFHPIWSWDEEKKDQADTSTGVESIKPS